MATSGQTSIVQLLDAAERDPAAAPELLAQVYGQLRVLARHYLQAERSDHTLQATAVVHEAYLRLVGGTEVNWESPAHFFAAATMASNGSSVIGVRAMGVAYTTPPTIAQIFPD